MSTEDCFDATFHECYDETNIYDAQRIYDKFFQLDKFMTNNENFRQDMAIAFMFARFLRHLDKYRDLLNNKLLGENTICKLYEPKSKIRPYNPCILIVNMGNIIIIVIRGSHTVGDWLTDIAFKSKSLPDLMKVISGKVSGKLVFTSVVHQGMLHHTLVAFNDLLSDKDFIIYKNLNFVDLLNANNKNLKFVIYGHSLGAACGVILSCMLASLGASVECTVISCPPIFCSNTDLYPKITYRHYYPYRDFAAVPPSIVRGKMGVFFPSERNNIMIMPGISRRLPWLAIRDEHSLLSIIKADIKANSKCPKRSQYGKSEISENDVVSKLVDFKEAKNVVLIKMPLESLMKKYPSMIRRCSVDVSSASLAIPIQN